VYSGRIANSYATGKVSAGKYAGGLVGLLDDSYDSSSLDSCYRFGHDTAAASGAVVGGVVGDYDGGTLRAVYWDSSASGASVVCGDTKSACSGTALTDSLMLRTSSFRTFDFDSIWYQYDGRTPPLLRAFLTPLVVRARDTTKIHDGTPFEGGAGVGYSQNSLVDSMLLGAVTYGGSSQGAVDTGHYAITVGGLWSAQSGYLISYLPGTLWIGDSLLTVSLALPVARAAISRELATRISRSFGDLAQGSGAAEIGPGVSGNAQTVEALLPSTSNVRIDIYDNLGTPVISWDRDVDAYALANLDATGDGRWVLPVSWNGRTSEGTPATAGVYLWKIAVHAKDGRKLETVRKLGLR
jgi:hypothetical protein